MGCHYLSGMACTKNLIETRSAASVIAESIHASKNVRLGYAGLETVDVKGLQRLVGPEAYLLELGWQ